MSKHLSTIPVLLLAMLASVHGQLRPGHNIKRVRCELLSEPFESFSRDAADFFVLLPEHVDLRAGSELTLTVRPSPQLFPGLTGVMISVNGRKLSASLEGKNEAAAADAAIRLRAAVPEGIVAAGWNRVSVQLNTRPAEPDVGREVRWLVRRPECYLELACERAPLFSELARFPRSVGEEKLLHSSSQPGESGKPPLATVAILLPLQSRDIHLRACAILGARFGQLGYFSDPDCRVGLVRDWPKESAERNGLVVGLRDELGDLPILKDFSRNLAALKAGQGMLAEVILGKFPSQRRWLLVTGADDAGLENAILTLGSASAMAVLPPSPAIIESEPALPGILNPDPPGSGKIALKDMGVKEVRLRGYRGEQSIAGWWLPPGFELSSGSSLNLRLTHPRWLTNSFLEVLLNGSSLGQAPLTAEDASPTDAKIPLPAGLLSRDPMMITFRSSLNVAGLSRDLGLQEEAWVAIAGDSTLETTTTPIKATSLNQIEQLLVRDRFLRRAAFLLPADSSSDEMQMLFDLALRVGKQMPSSPVLWPEACRYSAQVVPPSSRLQGRSILLLGSVAQWRYGLPSTTRLPIEMSDRQSSVVQMLGRKNQVSSFEPSLLLMQLLPSPWSSEETLVTAGGWNGFATPSLKRMLAEAASEGKLFGNLCAMDASGRAAAYDSRRASAESFAERIHRSIPLGLSVEETNRRLARETVRFEKAGRVNERILYISGGLLLLLVLCRLYLLWDRERRRKKSVREETPLGSTP